MGASGAFEVGVHGFRTSETRGSARESGLGELTNNWQQAGHACEPKKSSKNMENILDILESTQNLSKKTGEKARDIIEKPLTRPFETHEGCRELTLWAR